MGSTTAESDVIEILLSQPAFERVALPYIQNLGRLGIEAHVRTVEPAQYQRLMDSFEITTAPTGTVVVMGKEIPVVTPVVTDVLLGRLQKQLQQQSPVSPPSASGPYRHQPLWPR